VTSSADSNAIVVDTGVFGADLLRTQTPLVASYLPFLAGRPALISFISAAELRYGARRAGWGGPRLRRLEDRIASAEIVWPGPDLAAAYVDLRVACAVQGHALGERIHEADRWIAATAVWLGVPLVTHDGVFRNTPGLRLLTTLT
jgi:predicted nucleic acid-binding protein